MKRALLVAVIFLAGCIPPPATSLTPTDTPSASASPTGSLAPAVTGTPAPSTACAPTDQDQYVYNPQRLQVLAPCVRVTGVVDFRRSEADGDFHYGLKLDPAYSGYVVAANSGVEKGDLVIEPVCERTVTQADAIATCKGDTDPLKPLPVVGEHVWMEGRYVADMDHGGWHELHPLYAWGLLP